MRSFLRTRLLPVCLALGAAVCAFAQGSTPAARQQALDKRFLHQRGIGVSAGKASSAATPPAAVVRAARTQRPLAAVRPLAVGSSATAWQPLGPLQVQTGAYGLVTGRVSSLAVDPSDSSGNTVYVGATGGGVWKSTNAAGNAGSVTFTPLTDDLPVFAGSFTSFPSLSIGAITVDPANPEVLLAGTGDTNDALDSYYGVGLLRSSDGGNTWSLIPQSSDADVSGYNYSFFGVGFAGFAWGSPAAGQVVVAAVSQSLEGLIVNSGFTGTAEMGLYYSQDAGQTWHLATISDGSNRLIQSANPATAPPGNAATSVVWNAQRRLFIAAIRFHGYYSSSDGISWTRLANQPGAGLSTAQCPANSRSVGSTSCPIFRGVLAVQPETGDTFALTTDANNNDQGLYRDACTSGGLAASSCTTATIAFGQQLADTALDDPANPGVIDQADYNLSLAAVPSQQDTILFAGTEDIYRCSLANSCAWRNTTNNQTCAAAQVAPSQHAVDGTFGSNGLVYFGNDGGLWRSTDTVSQTGAVCSAGDASHFQNLNGGLGSLAEISHLAVSVANASLVLAGMGQFGVVASESAAAQSGAGAWQQLLTGEGSLVAIDPNNANDWFADNGAGVAIDTCPQGGNCEGPEFTSVITRSDVEDDADYLLDPAPWILDPGNSANILLGTCRVWLGPATGGWSANDLLSGMLDGEAGSDCNGNAAVRAVAAGGSYNSPLGGERMYAGMAGLIDGGGSVPGHLYGATVPPAGGIATWTDLWNSPVVNNTATPEQFNSSENAISAIAVDPHDPTGQTLYAGVSGFPSGVSGILYQSTDGGAHWNNITNSLPFAPVNAVVVDPANANYVYVAGDFGVFSTGNVATCITSTQNCWAQLGSGLPNAPVTDLKISSTATGNVLEAATYGRGVWTLGLTTSFVTPQATLTPTSFTFPAQAMGLTSATVAGFTLQNTGSVALTLGSIATTGDYAQANNCGGSLAAGAGCTLNVTFTPTATGDRPGILNVHADTQTGLLSATLDGIGLVPGTLTLTPGTLGFATTATGTNSQPLNVAVQNTGGAPVTMGALTIVGSNPNDFSLGHGNTCIGELAPGAACNVPVIFNPLQTGGRSAQLQVAATDASGGPFAIALTGNAITPPQLVLSPATIAFPVTTQNSVSPVQTILASNTGQQPAQIGATSLAGDFLLSSDDCPATLQPGGTCTLAVAFAPTQPGNRSGTLTMLSPTAPNGLVEVALTGTANPAGQVSLSPASLAFGTVALGASTTETASFSNQAGGAATLNSIAATGDYAVTGGTCSTGASIPAGGSCTVTLTFAPAAASARTGALTVASSGVPQTLATTLSGNGVLPATVAPGAGSIAFGNVPLGSSASVTITVTNSGGVAASLNAPTTAGSGFALGANGCGTTLAANSSCTVQVMFNPLALGAASGAFHLAGTFSGSPVNVALNGTGIASVLSFQPNPVAFASIAAQTTATQPVTVTNISAAAVTLGEPIVSSGFSYASTCPPQLAAGGSCTVQVTFAPIAAQAYAGVLSIPASSGSASSVALSGVGLSPGLLSASPLSIQFAATVVGARSGSIPVTVTNTGQSPAQLSAPQLSSADYAVAATTCGATLAAGAACSVLVAFSPTAAGDRPGTLTLAASGSNTVQVALDGAAIAPASLAFSPASLTFAAENINTSSAPQTLMLVNTGGVAATLGSPSVTGQFTLAGTTCAATLAPGATCTVSVEFLPQSGGQQSGKLSIAGSSSGVSLVAAASLTGTADTLGLSPGSVVFATPMVIGSTASPLGVALENLGNTPISLAALSITGDFAIQSTSCGGTLGASTSCIAYITFTPTAAGPRTGTLTLSNGTETHAAQLSGTGLNPATDALAPGALVFPSAIIGAISAAQNVVLTNSGDATLKQIAVTSSGPFIVSNNCGASLGGHLSCAIAVSYEPSATGTQTGTLTVTDVQRTQTVSLTGSGAAAPRPFLTPLSIDFGPYALNTATPQQSVTVTNGGASMLTDLAVSLSPAQFTVAASTCGATLAPGASCQLGVVFQASTPGPVNGVLQVTSPQLPAPLSTTLTGAGEDFQLAVVGNASAVVTPGQTATYQLSVTPVGASAGTVTIACSGAPAGSTCTPNPAAVTLSNGASGSITLQIATAAATTVSLRHWGESAAAMAILVPFFWRRRTARRWLLSLAMVALLAAPIGCGVHASGAAKTPQTQSGTYTLTVAASFPGAQRTATVTLTVE